MEARVEVSLVVNEESFKATLAALARQVSDVAVAANTTVETASKGATKAAESARQSVTVSTAAARTMIAGLTADAERASTARTTFSERASERESVARDKSAAAAERAAQREIAAAEKAAATEAASAERAAAASAKADELRAASDKRYQELRAEYEAKGLQSLREKIGSEEALARKERLALTEAVKEGASKEVQEVLKIKARGIQSELQLYRSLEKEKTGGYTFTQILEKQQQEAVKNIRVILADLEGLRAKKAELDARMLAETQRTYKEEERAAQQAAKAELVAEIESVNKQVAELSHLAKAAEGEMQKVREKVTGAFRSMGEGMKGALVGGVAAMGIQGVTSGIEGLMEKGKELEKEQRDLRIAFKGNAEECEKNEESMKVLHNTYGTNKEDLVALTKTYLGFGGTTDNLSEKQEAMLAVQQKTGLGFDRVAKLFGKNISDEAAKDLASLGIHLDKTASAEDRFRAITEKMQPTLGEMRKSMQDPGKQLEVLEDSFKETEKSVGHMLLTGFSPFVGALNVVSKILNDDVIPVVDKYGAVIKPLALVLGVGAVAIGAYSVAMGVKAAMTGTSTVATIYHTAVQTAHNVVTWLGVAATTAFGIAVAVATSPVTLIVVAIGALAAGLIYAYKHSEAFRNIVDAVASAVWSAIKFFAEWLNPIGLLVKGFQLLYEKVAFVRTAIDATVGAVKSAGHAVMEFLGLAKSKEEERTASEEEESAKRKAALEKEFTDKDAVLDEGYNEEARKLNVQRNTGKISEEQHRRAMLEIDVKYWKDKVANAVAFGKDDYDAQEKLHAAEVKIEEEKKKERAEHAKAAKEAHAKRLEDIRTRAEELRAEAEVQHEEGTLDEESYKKRLLKIQHDMDDEILAAAAGHGKDLIKARQAIRKDVAAEKKLAREEERATADAAHQSVLDKLEADKESELITEKAYNHKKLEAELAYRKQLLALADGTKEETAAQAAVTKAQAAITAFDRSEAHERLAIAKELHKDKLAMLEVEVSLMKDGEEKKAAQERIALIKENDAFEEEQDRIKEQVQKGVYSAQDALDMKLAAERKHAALVAEIHKKSAEEEIAAHKKSLEFLTGPVVATYNKGWESIRSKFVAPLTAGIKSSIPLFGDMAGAFVENLVKMGEEAITQKLVQLATNILFGEATAAAYAPAAAAASTLSFGTAAVTGLTALSANVPAMLGLFAVPKGLAEGAIVTDTVFGFGSRGAYAAGEKRGNSEVVMPLREFPKMIQPFMSVGGQQYDPKVHGLLTDIHRAILHNQPVAILDQDRNILSMAAAQRARDRRVIRGRG